MKKFIERRRRGVFGYLMLIIFWLANGLMALWFFSAMVSWGKMGIETMTEAQKAGAGVGIAVGLGVIFSIWAAVALITGIFVMLTRGRKEITEIEI